MLIRHSKADSFQKDTAKFWTILDIEYVEFKNKW
jgi:hypothetical protein